MPVSMWLCPRCWRSMGRRGQRGSTRAYRSWLWWNSASGASFQTRWRGWNWFWISMLGHGLPGNQSRVFWCRILYVCCGHGREGPCRCDRVCPSKQMHHHVVSWYCSTQQCLHQLRLQLFWLLVLPVGHRHHDHPKLFACYSMRQNHPLIYPLQTQIYPDLYVFVMMSLSRMPADAPMALSRLWLVLQVAYFRLFLRQLRHHLHLWPQQYRNRSRSQCAHWYSTQYEYALELRRSAGCCLEAISQFTFWEGLRHLSWLALWLNGFTWSCFDVGFAPSDPLPFSFLEYLNLNEVWVYSVI